MPGWQHLASMKKTITYRLYLAVSCMHFPNTNSPKQNLTLVCYQFEKRKRLPRRRSVELALPRMPAPKKYKQLLSRLHPRPTHLGDAFLCMCANTCSMARGMIPRSSADAPLLKPSMVNVFPVPCVFVVVVRCAS